MINIKVNVAELLQLYTSDNSTKKDHRLAGLFEQLLQDDLDSSLEMPQIVQVLEAGSDKTIAERPIELTIDEPKYNEFTGNELAYLLLGIDLNTPQANHENKLESEEVTKYLVGSSELENTANNVLAGQNPIILDASEDTSKYLNQDSVVDTSEKASKYISEDSIDNRIDNTSEVASKYTGEKQVQTRPLNLALGTETKHTLRSNQMSNFSETSPKELEQTIIKQPILDNVPRRAVHIATDKSSNSNKSFAVTGKIQIEDLKLTHNSGPLSSGQEVVIQDLPLDISLNIPLRKQTIDVFNEPSEKIGSNVDTSKLDFQVSEFLETLEPQVEIFNTRMEPGIFKSLPSQIIPNEILQIDVEDTEETETETEEHLLRYNPDLKTKSRVSNDKVTTELTQTKSESSQDINLYTSKQEIGNSNPVETIVLGEISTDALTQPITEAIPEVEPASSQTSTHQLEFQDEVIEQIVDRMAFRVGQEHQEVRIQLKPDYLGEVSIKLAIERGIVRAEFVAENQAVREIIAASLPQLKINMEQVGIQLGDVNVNLGNGQDSNDSRDRQQQSSNRVINQPEASKFIAEPSLLDGYSQINIRA